MPTPRVTAFEPNPLWQRAREPIFWLDPALKLIWVNRAWEELTGHASSSVLGLTCQPHGPTRAGDPADLAASFHPPPEAMAGQPSGSPTLIYHAGGGEPMWRRIEFWPFRDEHDRLIGLLGTVRPTEDRPSVPDSEGNRLHVELLEIRRRLQESYGLDSLIGFGPAHRRLLDQVRLAAGSGVPVLIVGEPGTGKRHVARGPSTSRGRAASGTSPRSPSTARPFRRRSSSVSCSGRRIPTRRRRPGPPARGGLGRRRATAPRC